MDHDAGNASFLSASLNSTHTGNLEGEGTKWTVWRQPDLSFICMDPESGSFQQQAKNEEKP
jgi:hypothetical protein